MAADREARIWAVVGASGTGKGLWIKQQLRGAMPAGARLVVWDFMDEYGEFAAKVTTLRQVHALMLKHRRSGLRIRYVPRGAGDKAVRKEFEALCEMVYAWAECTFIAEELANVTTPGWAPAAWRKMTTSGRHQGIQIVGTTQTPALVDKTFLGNCTLVHVCALREQPHRMYVARAIDVDVARVTALQKFQWIERDYQTGALREGTVPVPGAKSLPRPSPTGSDAPKRLQGPKRSASMEALTTGARSPRSTSRSQAT